MKTAVFDVGFSIFQEVSRKFSIHGAPPSWLELNLKRNNKATFYDSPGFLAVPLTNVLGTQGQLLS